MKARSRSARSRVLLAGSSLFALVRVLVKRMERDLRHNGALRTSTAGAMWGTYALYSGLVAVALMDGENRTSPVQRWAGISAAAVGGAVTTAGIRRFAGPAQLTGTQAGDLLTGGIYRYSRNPQYVGLVTVVAGLAVARRSPLALGLAGGLAAIYRAWVPIEERQLVDQFGVIYRDYCARAPRWIGRATSGVTRRC